MLEDSTMRLSAVGLIVTLALGFLMTPPEAKARQAAKIPRIGGGVPAEPSLNDPNIAAFRRALHDLGYVEGQTIAIEWRLGHGKVERFSELIAELVGLKVDVMVVGSGIAALAAKNATTTIPIIGLVGDAVSSGLVASLARPGGNVTGFSFASGEGISGKRVELLKEAIPEVSRMAVLRDPTISPLMSPIALKDMQVAAQALGLTLQPFEVRDPNQFDSAFAAMTTEHAQALITDDSAFFIAYHRRIVDLAATHRLPAIYTSRRFVEAGGLMSYGVSIADLWRRAATYVDKILKGAKPADLPVQLPMKFELVINLKTAQELGLTIPPTLLFQADEVIR
jgi:putative ABC transport system substrate-binding protein